MEHVVFFPAHDGTPAFRRLESLEEAVRFVEHLRNVEGVDHATVHALTEVPLAFKAYYRVEMPGEAPQVAAPEAPQAEVVPMPLPAQAGEPAPLAMVVVDGGEGAPVPPLAEVPAPAAAPEQQQPAEPAKASMGFFSRG
jgi:hypothetical protein